MSGQRDMPVWGLTFRDMARDTQRDTEVRDRIRDMVAYLETLQADPEESDG